MQHHTTPSCKHEVQKDDEQKQGVTCQKFRKREGTEREGKDRAEGREEGRTEGGQQCALQGKTNTCQRDLRAH